MRLLELQALDLTLDQLAHRRRTLPEEIALAGIDAELTQLRDLIIAGQTELSDLDDLVAKADTDVEQVRQRSARDQEMLDSGRITSAKELESIQHEVVSLQRRQSDLEDVELEVLERAEGARNSLTALQSERAAKDAAREQLANTRDAVAADIAHDSDQARTERAKIAETIPAELLSLYEKLRAASGGIGAARVHQGRCEGCRMQLTPIDLGRIRTADADAVVRCEECRRILVRTDESGLGH